MFQVQSIQSHIYILYIYHIYIISYKSIIISILILKPLSPVLICEVGTYAACPLTVSWAKVVGFGEDGLPIKGRPFKEGSVIVATGREIPRPP